ncbi:MAG: hypothetical protein I3273_05350 [Candidatus Moeniiplasma glomeromycotorum]|nr:hypothetical protein [Candidatus Moeniiplasma glomeromycotorum]MCE8167992.1 hypothetical protein [Candidatus Moeniiplasma glomeromycotorum]MCE8169515.1 hypothetical protein [Candidatus Moeniiplasma glomeromycotorum]
MQQNTPYLLKERLWKILSNNQLLNKLSVANIKEIVNVYEEVRKNQKSNHFKVLVLNSQEVQIKEITEEFFSVLESEEEIIQNFNREYEKIFL